MYNRFLQLLRNNFRCGRMLCSRADDMVGRSVAPIIHAAWAGKWIIIHSSGDFQGHFRTFLFVKCGLICLLYCRISIIKNPVCSHKARLRNEPWMEVNYARTNCQTRHHRHPDRTDQKTGGDDPIRDDLSGVSRRRFGPDRPNQKNQNNLIRKNWLERPEVCSRKKSFPEQTFFVSNRKINCSGKIGEREDFMIEIQNLYKMLRPSCFVQK